MHVRRSIINFRVFINALIVINEKQINYIFNYIFVADNPPVNITSQKQVIGLILNINWNRINFSNNLLEQLLF